MRSSQNAWKCFQPVKVHDPLSDSCAIFRSEADIVMYPGVKPSVAPCACRGRLEAKRVCTHE